MRILVYGFGPYTIFRENITSKIIKNIKSGHGVHKKIFKSKFDKTQFIDAIKKANPDIIIGLGQAGGPRNKRKKIALERKALNMKSDGKGINKIEKSKPQKTFVNLRLKKDRNSRISYNA